MTSILNTQIIPEPHGLFVNPGKAVVEARQDGVAPSPTAEITEQMRAESGFSTTIETFSGGEIFSRLFAHAFCGPIPRFRD